MASPPGHVAKDKIAEARRAINDGNEDCIGLEKLGPPPKCEFMCGEKLYREAGHCPHSAKFKTRDGTRFCQIHAELWAAMNN